MVWIIFLLNSSISWSFNVLSWDWINKFKAIDLLFFSIFPPWKTSNILIFLINFLSTLSKILIIFSASNFLSMINAKSLSIFWKLETKYLIFFVVFFLSITGILFKKIWKPKISPFLISISLIIFGFISPKLASGNSLFEFK